MLGCHFQGFEEENSRAFTSSEAEEQETNLMGLTSNPAVNTFRFQKVNCTKILFIVLCKHLKCKTLLGRLDKALGLIARSLGAADPAGWQTISPCKSGTT